tara:strand:+ start:22 stop:1242 length:1221 start_codon:yes stop_codon:yes gene_type:complete
MHTWKHRGEQVMGFFTEDQYQPIRNLLGTIGQVATTESAISDLRGMGESAKTFIGFPEDESLYDTIEESTQFKPFTVTAMPGSVATTAKGGTTYSLSDEQTALESSLRTGGSRLVNALLGRGEYGTLDEATGEYSQNLRADQQRLIDLLEVNALDPQGQTFRGTRQAEYIRDLSDPFSAVNLAGTESTVFNRLQALRAPGEERERLALDQKLFAQGRQGLRTAQYGGSPEELSLNQAIQEQRSADALSAMSQARTDAATRADLTGQGIDFARLDQDARSRARLQALQQQADEKQITANIADTLLSGSYRGGQELIKATQPSVNLADIATVAGRQMGGYSRDLGSQYLDYDLATEEQAVELRRQSLKSLFDLLIAENNQMASRQPIAINPSAMPGGGGTQPGFTWPW